MLAKDRDYATLTDEIYKSTFNMNTAQYKELKGISKTKRNLRDSMELSLLNNLFRENLITEAEQQEIKIKILKDYKLLRF